MFLRLQNWTRPVLAGFAIGLTCIGLAACGGSSGNDASAESSSTEATTTAGSQKGVNHGRFPLPVKDGSYEEQHPGAARYGSTPLLIEADPSGAPRYTKKKVTAKEGNVTIEFTNPQAKPQNFTIEFLPSHEKEESETVQEGFAAFTVTLTRKNKYIFYSSVPGEREAGMEGEIVVTR